MIEAYFTQIKALLDRYAATSSVLDVRVSFEMRPGEQGYLSGLVTFVDSSQLHFSEFLDAAQGKMDKLMYTYHYQGAGDQLIFRYDNARHRPPLSFPDHKHTAEQIAETPSPSIDDVLAEIVMAQGWM